MRLLALALLFTAQSALADTAVSPKAAETPALSVWRAADGGYEHLQTGLSCPDKLAGYRRTGMATFDTYGLDVGCDYSIGSAALTYYLTRREGPGGLDAAMAEAKRELLQAGEARHARLLSETTVRDGDLDWTVALFGEDGDMRSGIWIADLFGWTFEYRATYPAADEARMLADIKAVTAGIRASAGARLQLCARAAAPARPGKPVKDAARIEEGAMMSSIMGGAMLAAVEKERKEKPGEVSPFDAPPTWCVERGMTQAGYSMLFWRGVSADGTDAPDDRITLVTQTRPPETLVVSAGGMSGLIEALNKKDDAPQQWTASLEHDGQTLIFGYFEGRPSAELVADLFARALAGKQKPVGGYSAKGKTINIVVPPK